MRLAELECIGQSGAAQVTLAENYIRLPLA
jgi:hypothetical protein